MNEITKNETKSHFWVPPVFSFWNIHPYIIPLHGLHKVAHITHNQIFWQTWCAECCDSRQRQHWGRRRNGCGRKYVRCVHWSKSEQWTVWIASMRSFKVEYELQITDTFVVVESTQAFQHEIWPFIKTLGWTTSFSLPTCPSRKIRTKKLPT